jgi:hypothetical protein
VAVNLSRARTAARYTLAAIRLFNGTAALFAPRQLGQRTGANPDANPAAVYVLRLFGVRTIYVGAELLQKPGPHLQHAVLAAPAIHASDAISAAAAGAAGQLPQRSARLATAISSVNFLLALLVASGWKSCGAKRRRCGR